MGETCNKHDDCLGRIHTEINEILVNNAELKGNIDSFLYESKTFREAVRKDLYDPKEGLGAKVNSHATQLGLQWGVITTIVGSIIVGVIVGVVISWMKK